MLRAAKEKSSAHDLMLIIANDVAWLKWAVGGLYAFAAGLMGFKIFGG